MVELMLTRSKRALTALSIRKLEQFSWKPEATLTRSSLQLLMEPVWSQMLDKFDELSSWSRNAHRGGRIHRSLRHFPLRRVALDFVEGTEHAFSLRHCVGMTLRSGI